MAGELEAMMAPEQAGKLQRNLIQRVNVGDSLTRAAARYPDRLAVVEKERRLTYAEFNALVNRFANGLSARGYASGDVLALAAGNCVEFLVTYYGCAKLGVVCVPVNLGWRSDEVSYVLGHSGARGIVIEAALLAAYGDAIAKQDAVADAFVVGEGAGAGGPGAEKQVALAGVLAASAAEPEAYVADRDPLTYLYTSGTTSFPKGVVGSHLAVYLESLMIALESRYSQQDRVAAMMPLFHTAQLNGVCTAVLMVGGCVHLLRGFDPGALLELIEKEKITQIFGLPVMYRALLDHPAIGERDTSSLRLALYAMAPMPDALLRQCIEVLKCDVALGFGQTEMSPVTTYFRPEHQLSHPGAVGTQVVNVQVAIMNEAGELLPRGEEGEIVYRGPQALTEYLHNEEATEEAFAHGWFHSGDVGRLEADGMLWFSDRRKDVIKTGGENVASIEVEKAIYAASPDVAEAIVVGLPHERWGEAITAIVVPRPGAQVPEQALLAALRAHLDPYKIPKAVITVAEPPRTSTGKVQKNVLREQYARQYEK